MHPFGRPHKLGLPTGCTAFKEVSGRGANRPTEAEGVSGAERNEAEAEGGRQGSRGRSPPPNRRGACATSYWVMNWRRAEILDFIRQDWNPLLLMNWRRDRQEGGNSDEG